VKRYFAKRRYAGWLAAALLALLGLAGSPSAGMASPRTQSSVVWVDGARGPAEQAHEAIPAAAPAPEPAPVSFRRASDFDPSSTPLDRALFQRPPPVLLFFLN
jgi:hypothetical protein